MIIFINLFWSFIMYYFYLYSFLLFSVLCVIFLMRFMFSNKEKTLFASAGFFSLALGAVLASLTHGGFYFLFFCVSFGVFGLLLVLLYSSLRGDSFVKNIKRFSDFQGLIYVSIASGFYFIFMLTYFVITDVLDNPWMEEIVYYHH